MSLLWKDVNNKNLLIMHERPSSTCNNHISRFAQSKISRRKGDDSIASPISLFIEGLSLFISSNKKIAGSMTVEAAIVLPIFVFFFLNIGSAIEMIRLHGNLQLSLWEVGNRLSVYGHAIDNKEDDTGWMEMSGIALSYTYVKSQIVEYLGEEYLESSPLSYGTDGLQFAESNIWESDGKFELVLTYSVSPLSDMAGFHSFRMANRYYGHLWNGYHIATIEKENSEEYVYLTENGGVYHTNRNCTHLVLSVSQISLQEAYVKKNKQGQNYKACEKCCKGGYIGNTYITEEGDCYHYERECPGLKRTVYRVPISEASNLKICQRCSS